MDVDIVYTLANMLKTGMRSTAARSLVAINELVEDRGAVISVQGRQE